ncbi:hypothetical protein [Aquipuribacter hungaricus]|uniref:DUF8175 domain-containing protein n=1 Tax=Aquipuribacter hungaricus TaxID=545624 RepID=A0ABV7WKY8_9MICO
MAEEQVERNPWTRGGFIAAAGVVAVLVILGVVLTITGTRADQPGTALPSTVASTSDDVAAPEPSASSDGADSVCGLDGQTLEGTLAAAPTAEWQYQGTTAYPTSPEFGPGEVTDEGVRSCYQRSPEGAVFAAANAVVQGTDPSTVEAWLDYFIADTSARKDVVTAAGNGDTSGTRAAVQGFRLLAYDGNSATVDVAVRGSTDGEEVNLSMVYDLVWEDGDWKLVVTDPRAPVDVAFLPDLAGYSAWSA